MQQWDSEHRLEHQQRQLLLHLARVLQQQAPHPLLDSKGLFKLQHSILNVFYNVFFFFRSSFSFGASNQPLPFGAATPAPAFNFSTTTTAAPAFGFGATATSTAAPSFGFGQATNPTSQAPSLFGNTSFGGFGATAAPAFGSSAAPAFGSSAAPAFGSTAAPAFGSSAAPAFGSAAAPAFGQGTGFGGKIA